MNCNEAALLYCIVRRFGNQGKFGGDLDAFVKSMLKDETVRHRCLRDYDSMFSDSLPDDLLGLNAMVGE